jgi:acyl carrier protein
MTWTRDAIRSDLWEVFEQHAQDGAAFSDSSRLVADLGIDSLGVMELVADIEDKFSLTIPDEALREVETIADVRVAIEVRLKADGRLAE